MTEEKPQTLWIVMKLMKWSSFKWSSLTHPAIPVDVDGGASAGFMLVFKTKKDAVAFDGSSKYVRKAQAVIKEK